MNARDNAAEALKRAADLLAVAAALIELDQDADAVQHVRRIYAALGAGIGAQGWGAFAHAVEDGLTPLAALAVRAPEAQRSLVVEVLKAEAVTPAHDRTETLN